MEYIKLDRLNDQIISNSIRNVVEESSYLKSKVFNSLITLEDLRPEIANNYKKFVKDYIDIWKQYSENLSNRIKTAKGIDGIRTVDFNYVKDYIYSSDDYASVLPFADGVIKGVKSGKFKNPEDIENFFKYTVEKAYDNKGYSVASLLDSVLIDGIIVDMVTVTSKYDAKLFDNTKKYSMFKSTDATELSKSIFKVVDFISNEMGDTIREIKHTNAKMFVSMVNHIVEYISFSLAAYSTRIYIISQYAYPFINTSEHDLVKPKAVVESTDDPYNGELTPSLEDIDNTINIMHNASELTCRSYKNVTKYIETLSMFAKSIGADVLFGTNKPQSNAHIPLKFLNSDNLFVNKLMANPLYMYLLNTDNFRYEKSSSLTETNQLLKGFIYNNAQAYPSAYTPKQEFLYIIRGVKTENTIDGYKRLVKDMYIAASVILSNIAGIINCTERYDIPGNRSIVNDYTENIKMLNDLYTEIAVAFMHKGRDIELKFNNLKNSQFSKIKNDLSLEFPYQKLDLDTNINMMNSVPNTTRAPYDILDLYDLPTFESLEMYDEYLRHIPGMEHDTYLSEAGGGISSIINAIISMIKSAFQRLCNFYNHAKFKAARKWVIEHQNEIKSMDFTNKKLYILPYKHTIKLPQGWNNLINNLKNFSEKDFESEDSIKNFIKSLYPNEKIYTWFNPSNNEENIGAQLYRNLILFYDINEVKKETPQAIYVEGDKLKSYVENWTDTMVKSPEDIIKSFQQIKNNIENCINNIKNKLVTTQNTNTQNTNTQNNTADNQSGDVSKTGQDGKDGDASKTGQDGKDGDLIKVPSTGANAPSNNSEKLINDINVVIINLWGSLTKIFIHYYLTEYKYLKDAYAIGHITSN